MASYPSAIREFTIKRNLLDIVWAEHMNSMQDETRAIQETLGVVPHIATSNPGGRTPNHGTVASRIQSVARGEQVPIFRGSTREATVTPGTWHRPSLRADDDGFSMSTGTGIRLCETGLWAITIKADWKSTAATVQHQAARMLRLEIGGDDIGVRHVLIEAPANRYAMHNTVTWVDTYAKDTVVSMGVRTDCGGNPGNLLYNAYLRAHLVRCHPEGEGGSIPFDDIPDVVNPPPEVVTTPPDAVLRYTVIAVLSWYVGKPPEPGVNGGYGLGAQVQVIDNTHPAFASSPYPKFATFGQAAQFAHQLESDFWGPGNGWPMPNQSVIGTVWPST